MKKNCKITGRRLLSEHFIDGKKQTEVEVKTLYVTVQERAAAEDIKRAIKDEILKRIEDKLQQIKRTSVW